MGARLSQPRAADGTNEASSLSRTPTPTPRRPLPRGINSRTALAPFAAFTMACLLFVYTRTSIRAAKENAQRHREADGGEGLSLLNEHRRRHGLERKLERQGGTVRQLGAQLLGSGSGSGEGGSEGKRGRSGDEERLRAMRGRLGGRGGEGQA